MSWWSFTKAVLRGDHKLAPSTWGMGIFTALYTISPIDFIPDFLFPVVGYIDDLGMWGIFIALAAREKSRYEVAAQSDQYVKATRLS